MEGYQILRDVIYKRPLAAQVSVMTHCNERGSEMFVGDKAHIFLYEQGGASYVSYFKPGLIFNFYRQSYKTNFVLQIK